MSVSNVIYMSQVAMSICVRIAALDITVSISMLLTGLLEVSRMMVTTNNVKSILVWDWLSLWQTTILLSNFFTVIQNLNRQITLILNYEIKTVSCYPTALYFRDLNKYSKVKITKKYFFKILIQTFETENERSSLEIS